LLRAPGGPPEWHGLDAIIVPTIRHPANLAEAARLAGTLNCTLVTMHSGEKTDAASALRRLPDDIDLIAIDVTPPPRLGDRPPWEWLHLPPWETSRLLNRTPFARRTDVSAKRNLALMLSRMLDWSRILFLDDDITAPNVDDIKRAVGLLKSHNAVGLHIDGFPDNSVVCHAYRRVGGRQQSSLASLWPWS